MTTLFTLYLSSGLDINVVTYCSEGEDGKRGITEVNV